MFPVEMCHHAPGTEGLGREGWRAGEGEEGWGQRGRGGEAGGQEGGGGIG